MPKETLEKSVESAVIESRAEYQGGTIDYSIVGVPNEQNPILIVPGFTEGRTVLRNFATELASLGQRQVIFPDQPKIDRKLQSSIIDQQAEAILAILNKESITDGPIDVVAHSLGSLITIRMAELAKDRGIKAFESSKGSHSFFVAPAGSNDNENFVFLAGRFAKFMANGSRYGKELDPTGEMTKAGFKNFFRSPSKTKAEIKVLQAKEKAYRRIGDIGLRPFIFGYAADDMFPHKVIGPVISKHGDRLSGYAVPVDSGVVGASSFEEYKAKTGLRGKEARRSWAHHYRNAGHNDLLFHPDRTVRSILQVLER